ncbi:sensor domain-containing diguanylate cyclase [Sporosarcina aquimarina]|uniref:Sensor domain-containing diguanylate cyclase n=1 Tax=Sporosarcina aquimarina TaxID=114975 RepID=A0ABU4G0R4_9BACL|nr:sensor domain-containing diguanylate cyclase [Sporosarcina aquimarina]MDW0110486.1 sensor domain-containing diguanylate cyclase [Sporosarcina aquimarina]
MDERLSEAPCGFISMDPSGSILEVNNRCLNWLGYMEKDLIGKHVEALLTNVNRMLIHTYFFPTIQLHGAVEEFYINLKNSDGDSIPVLLNASRSMRKEKEVIDCMFIQMKQRINYEMELRSLQKTTEEAFTQLEKIYMEIAKKQAEILDMNDELLKLSNTDKLTGIPNRRFFQEEMEYHMNRFTKEGIVSSLLMVDIDHFKRVNDTYGHLAGDRVLVQLAGLLRQEICKEDCVARLGGEEFVIILPNTEAEEAMKLAVKLNNAIAAANWEIIDHLTVSIGAATFTGNDNETTIVNHADQALYQAKEIGRNCAIHFDDLDLRS